MRWLRPRSLRGRTILFFGAGSLSVAALFAASTYLLTRGYLLEQRTESVQRRAAIDARVVSARLDTAGTQVGDALDGLDPLSASVALVRQGGDWYSTSLDVGAEAVPEALARVVASGRPAMQVTAGAGGPVVVVGVPMPSVGAQLYEVAPLDDLRRNLNTLAAILGVGTVVSAAAGAAIAVWSSRHLLEPLDAVAGAAAEIAGGELSRRLEPTDDADLVTIVGSFNSMVDALQSRIERDARFAGDVSHELRTPLTTLVAAVDVLQADRGGLSSRQQRALALTTAELDRFRRLLDDLIELARYDGGLRDLDTPTVDLSRLLEKTLDVSGRPVELLHGAPGAFVRGDKRRLERVFLNLFDNADQHGGGLVGVTVTPEQGRVLVSVDDGGPGIPFADRERVFARFATGGRGRRSATGTGLGLAIVRETVTSLGGQAWCTSRPGGGARFVVDLPRVEGP